VAPASLRDQAAHRTQRADPLLLRATINRRAHRASAPVRCPTVWDVERYRITIAAGGAQVTSRGSPDQTRRRFRRSGGQHFFMIQRGDRGSAVLFAGGSPDRPPQEEIVELAYPAPPDGDCGGSLRDQAVSGAHGRCTIGRAREAERRTRTQNQSRHYAVG